MVSGMNRALFQRTGAALSEDDSGGQTVRGGATKPIPSMNGKQELKQTADVARRAVASNHSASRPMRDIALVTALNSESL
jgi:hypothetical protein